MKIRVEGTDPRYTKTYEGDSLTYKIASGFLSISDKDGERIGVHVNGMWGSLYTSED